MEGTVDRIEAGKMEALPQVIAPQPQEIAPQPLESEPDQEPAPSRIRPFDDIPTVVRALLTGYDEV